MTQTFSISVSFYVGELHSEIDISSYTLFPSKKFPHAADTDICEKNFCSRFWRWALVDIFQILQMWIFQMLQIRIFVNRISWENVGGANTDRNFYGLSET